MKKGPRARVAGDSAVARFTGSGLGFLAYLGLAPQALCCRPASQGFQLLVAHGGVHGGDDGFGDAALLQFGDLGGGEIEVHWRLFDPFNNRSF